MRLQAIMTVGCIGEAAQPYADVVGRFRLMALNYHPIVPIGTRRMYFIMVIVPIVAHSTPAACTFVGRSIG